MTETLITFETAKIAKQKGFHIMPDMFFDNIDTLRSTKILKMPGCYPGSVSFVSMYQEVDVYYAPSQSLLQKWLREVHNIDITIMIVGSAEYEYYIHKNKQLMKNNNSTVTTENQDNMYEFTLETGLLEALKLI